MIIAPLNQDAKRAICSTDPRTQGYKIKMGTKDGSASI